jgi:hypothetical protein
MVCEASMLTDVSLGIHVVGGLRVGVEPFLQPLVEGEEEQGGQLGFLQEVLCKVGRHPSEATVFNSFEKPRLFFSQSCETDF